jgi:site-specific recombinase XerD
MIEEMRMRDYSKHTISAYVSAVYRLAAFYDKSPDKLNREEIRAFLVDLVEEKKVAWSYYKQVLAALRYFYRYVLRRGEVVEDIRGPRATRKLPIVLSVEEVSRFFKAIPSLKHRTILMLAYGAGLRIGEAVRVRLADMDRQRMVLRVSQGKGKKDRRPTCGRCPGPLAGAVGDVGPLLLGGAAGGSVVHHAFQGPADHRQHNAAGLEAGPAGRRDRQDDHAAHAAS